MNSTPRPVGRVTVALGLVAAGTALLLDNLLEAGPRCSELVLRFWPVFLIGFGLEYVIGSRADRTEDRRPLHFDVGGAALLAGVLALTAVFRSVTGFTDVAVPSVPAVPAPAQQTQVRTIPAAGATALVVDIDVGQVTLFTQDADEVRVEVQQAARGLFVPREGAAPTLDLTTEGGRTVRVTGRNWAQGFHLGVWQTIYQIYAPAGLSVTVRTDAGTIAVRDYRGDLELAADAGSISVVGGEGSLVAATDSGSIQVMHFAGPVNASTSAGAIGAVGVDGALSLHSGTGIITVTEHGGAALTAETRTGTITASLLAPPQGPIALRTTTGAIRLELPEGSDVTIRASTQSGGLSGLGPTSGEGASRAASTTLGAGTHPVTLEANTGSISVSLR